MNAAFNRSASATRLGADEHLGGDVERQLLGRPVELKAAAGLPAGDAPLDRRVHLLQVPDQTLVLERLLHDPSVVAVLLEVHQHHAPVEERPDQRIPSELVGERAIAVGQHGLEAARAEHLHPASAERVQPEHRPEPLVVAPRVTKAVVEELERVPDDRQPGIAHHRLEPAPARRRRQRPDTTGWNVLDQRRGDAPRPQLDRCAHRSPRVFRSRAWRSVIGSPGSRSVAAVGSEVLLDGHDHSGLVVGDGQEPRVEPTGTLPTAIMNMTPPTALGLDVAGQAVPEHDDLAGRGPDHAVAGLRLRVSGGRDFGLRRPGSRPTEDRQRLEQGSCRTRSGWRRRRKSASAGGRGAALVV